MISVLRRLGLSGSVGWPPLRGSHGAFLAFPRGCASCSTQVGGGIRPFTGVSAAGGLRPGIHAGLADVTRKFRYDARLGRSRCARL